MVFHICGDKLITQPYMRIGKTVSNEIYYLRTVVPTKLQDPREIAISHMPTPDDDEAIRSNWCTSMKNMEFN